MYHELLSNLKSVHNVRRISFNILQLP